MNPVKVQLFETVPDNKLRRFSTVSSTPVVLFTNRNAEFRVAVFFIHVIQSDSAYRYGGSIVNRINLELYIGIRPCS